ncbi:MAG: hypothetical protein ABEJ95_04595 [Candidatus Nanohalobium sp.]
MSSTQKEDDYEVGIDMGEAMEVLEGMSPSSHSNLKRNYGFAIDALKAFSDEGLNFAATSKIANKILGSYKDFLENPGDPSGEHQELYMEIQDKYELEEEDYPDGEDLKEAKRRIASSIGGVLIPMEEMGLADTWRDRENRADNKSYWKWSIHKLDRDSLNEVERLMSDLEEEYDNW